MADDFRITKESWIMHAHDRTLVAKLGFNDPDRNNPLHDRACQFLALPENCEMIVNRFYDTSIPDTVNSEMVVDVSAEPGPPIHEAHIGKGTGQYRTTIGYADLILPYRVILCGSGFKIIRVCIRHLAIEVKVSSVPIGDLLRQINLYREYTQPTTRWLVASYFDFSPIDLITLIEAGLAHIRLGDSFDSWMKQLSDSGPRQDHMDESLVF